MLSSRATVADDDVQGPRTRRSGCFTGGFRGFVMPAPKDFPGLLEHRGMTGAVSELASIWSAQEVSKLVFLSPRRSLELAVV